MSWSPLGCPPGFTYIHESDGCYKAIQEAHDFDTSRRRCVDSYPGAYLAVINDKAEDVAIGRYLNSQYPSRRCSVQISNYR